MSVQPDIQVNNDDIQLDIGVRTKRQIVAIKNIVQLRPFRRFHYDVLDGELALRLGGGRGLEFSGSGVYSAGERPGYELFQLPWKNLPTGRVAQRVVVFSKTLDNVNIDISRPLFGFEGEPIMLNFQFHLSVGNPHKLLSKLPNWAEGPTGLEESNESVHEEIQHAVRQAVGNVISRRPHDIVSLLLELDPDVPQSEIREALATCLEPWGILVEDRSQPTRILPQDFYRIVQEIHQAESHFLTLEPEERQQFWHDQQISEEPINLEELFVDTVLSETIEQIFRATGTLFTQLWNIDPSVAIEIIRLTSGMGARAVEFLEQVLDNRTLPDAAGAFKLLWQFVVSKQGSW